MPRMLHIYVGRQILAISMLRKRRALDQLSVFHRVSATFFFV